jgi:large repetitive protein
LNKVLFLEKNAQHKSRLGLIFLIFISLALTTCDLFSPGLGESVDIDAPEVGVESHGNGEYIAGAVTLAGYARDDQGIQSVSVTHETGTVSAAYGSESWSGTIDTTLLSDGEHEFTITATDSTGKTAKVSLFLIIDNTPPTVLVTAPTDYTTREFNKTLAIKGDATDTTRVDRVLISLYSSLDDSPVFQDQAATGTTSWYYIFDSEGYALDGSYYFSVQAEDKSGNSNTYFYTFDALYDLAVDPASIPNIEEIHAADYQGVPIGAGILSGPLSSIRNSTTPGERMEIGINPNSDLPGFIFISPSYSVNPADNVLASPQRLSGFVEDDDGVDTATLRIALYESANYPALDTPVAGHDWVAPVLSGNQWTYSVTLPDGEYWMKLTVDDIYGTNAVSEPAAFRVSSFAPVATILSPSQGIYVGSTSTVNLQVSVTGMGSGSVEVDPDGDDNYTNAIGMTDAGGGVWESSLAAGTDFTVIDGQQIFKIRAGSSGNYGYATLQFTGDITVPTVTVEVPPAGSSVNGSFNIAGTSSDNNLISAVYLWIDEDANGADDPPADPTSWLSPDSTDVYNWISNLNTTILNSGAHTIHVAAFDAAGNRSVPYSRAFTVDQESDRPVIYLSNLAEGGTTVDNGLGQDAAFIGYIEDDDNVDAASIEVRIDLFDDGLFPGVDLNSDTDTTDANESENWTPVSNPPGSDGRIVNWTHLLANVPQGQHSMQIRVHDVNSSGTPDEGTNPNYAETLVTDFMIDYGPPDLIISQPANNAVFNTGFVISGTASDANGVASIDIAFNGDPSIPVMAEAFGTVNATWSYSFGVDAGGADDGEYSYQIRATDLSGGTSTLDRQLIVDASAPTLVIEQPGAGSTVNGSTVQIRGTADDNRSVTHVYVDVNPDGTSPEGDHTAWDYSAAGTYSWGVVLNTLDLNNSDTPEDYIISVKAVDGAGNVSAEYGRSITIDQGSDRPVIDFNDIDKAETLAVNNVLVGATNLTGTIEDDDLVDPAAIEIKIDADGWTSVSSPPASPGKVVVWKHDISGLLEGPHTVRVRARDNQSDGTVADSSADSLFTTNFNWNIEDSADQSGVPFILNLGPPSVVISTPANYSYHNSDVLISGTAFDANGVDFVQISFDNGVTWLPAGGTPENWSYTLTVDPDGLDDATYSYLVRGTDLYGSTGVENGQFTIDATLPTAAVNQPSAAAVVNGLLTLNGTGADNTSLAGMYWHVGLSSAAAPSFPAGYNILGGTYSWNAVLDTTSLGDDTYTLRVVPIDSAGNAGLDIDDDAVTQVDFSVLQSSDRPVISLSSISAGGSFIENLLPGAKQVSGTVIDDDGVDASSIGYQVWNEAGDTQIEPASGWAAVTGAPGSDTTLASWTHTFGAGISDGKYNLKIRAADTFDLGLFDGSFDWSETAMVKFAVDNSNPITTITSPGANGGYAKTDFSVGGTASDAGGIKSISVQYGSDAAVPVYTDAAAASPSVTWSDTFDVDEATHGDDGVLNYTITVTDGYDKIKTYERYIIIDTQVPVINSLTLVNNDPTPGEVNGSVLIQGAPIDNESMVSAIYVQTAAAAPAEPPGVGWDLLPSTTTINYRFDSNDLTDESSYSTYLVVEDVAGNRTAVGDYSLSFTVDQSGNSPVITLNTGDGSVLTSLETISGSITDDDGVDVSSIQISIDGGAWTDVTSTSPSDSTSVTFSHSLAALDEQVDAYSIRIQAADTGEDFADDTQDVAPETVGSVPIAVFVDDSSPTAAVTQIDNGKVSSAVLTGLYVNDQFTLTGTALDGVQISDVRARLESDLPAFSSVSDTNGDLDDETHFDTWEWVRSGLSLSGSSELLYLEVEDIHGKVTPYSFTILVDTVDPAVVISTASSNPATVSGAYNGVQTFRGSSSDNLQINSVYYRFSGIGNPTTTDPVADSWTPASGTYSWNFDLDTVGDGAVGNNTASDSTVFLGVVAADSAGNISAVQNISFVINQGSDQPLLTVTQPTSGGLIESNKKVIGSLSDDDTLASLEIRIDRNNDNDFDDAGEGYVPVSQPAVVSGTNINFEHDLSALADGSYRIELRSRDSVYATSSSPFNETVSAVVSFDIDTVAPTLDLDRITVQNRYAGADTVITSGFNGSYINNDSILEVSASDSSGIDLVDISTDGGSNWSDATDNGDGTYSFALAVSGLSEGTNNITYRATDNRGKVSSKILTIIVDTGEPVIDFTTPAGVTTLIGDDAPNVNGDVLLRGSVSDSSSVSSVFLVGGIDPVGDPVNLTNNGNTISWQTTIGSSGIYANATYADDQGSNIWRFPVEVTAQDIAGNISIATGYLDIDPDGDRPVVSVVAPSDGSSVSGTFLVNGTITDDDGTDHVEIQIDLNNDGDYDDSFDLDGGGISSDFENESVPVSIPAPNGSWSIPLSAGDYSKAVLIAAGHAAADGFLGFRVVPYDINGLAGAAQTFTVYNDSESPVIAGLDIDGLTELVDPTPASGTIQKGGITLRALFKDDKELLTTSMLISFDGGANFEQISAQPGYSIADVGTTDPYQYRIEIPIDTTAKIAGGNGVMQIQLSLTDQTNKQTSEAVQYNVDNDLPTIHWNEDGSGTLLDLPFIGSSPDEIYTYKGNSATAETDDAYKVLGSAIDMGTISGVEKVNVYFVKGGLFYSPTDGSSTPVANSPVPDGTGTPVSIPFTEDSNYLITINNRIEQGLYDQTSDIGDFDGFQESLKAKAGYDEWYSFFDTTRLPDGPLEIYSVVYDEAGNYSYTVADAQIANNPPTIPSVVVGSTTIDDSNDRTKVAGSVAFTINSLDAENIDVSTISMEVAGRWTVVSGGPGTRDDGYSPPPAYTYSAFDTKPAADTSPAQFIETISTDNGTPGIPGDDLFESGYYYEFLARVNDSDGNLVERTFYVWINNDDVAAPVVTIDDFSQTSVSGGGGHLEEEANSLNDTGDFDDLEDADLSGTVTVSGTAYDDSQVTALMVEYSLNNGLDWTDAGAAVLSTGVGDVINGYDYTWSYDWDTSTIPGVALEDVQIRAYGNDGTNITDEGDPLNAADNGDRPLKIVDIVPYITGITGAGFDSGLLTYVRRSAQGRYPIAAGRTISISGYNLPADAADGVSVGGTLLTAETGSTTTLLSVDLSGVLSSGQIFVTTNGVDSLNNLNDNTLPQNREANAYNPNLTDDREAVFWNVSGIGGTSTVTDPAMHPNAAGDDFDWMYVRSGQDLYISDGLSEKKLTEATGLRGGTLTYNDSGSLIFLFNHNAEWSFYDGSFAFTGSVQYGQIPDPSAYSFTIGEDEAYNWNQNSNFAKLGVGNVNFLYTGENNVSENPIPYSYSGVDLNRYENLRLKSVGSDTLTRNYVAYFDTGAGESRSIVFYAFQTADAAGVVSATVPIYSNTAAAAEADAGGGVYANLDKFTNASTTESVALAGTQKNNSSGIATPRGRQEVTAVNSGADSSQFDLAVFEETPGSVHYGYIAYFDEDNQSLKITANESLYTADPTGTLGSWTVPVTVDTNAGADVSMAVDPNGGIHLAYQDVSSGYLKYAYLTYDDGLHTFSIEEKVFVDALFGAGANNSLAVRDFGSGDYRPVITTFSSAFTGTRAPLRMSYPVTANLGSFGAGASGTTGAFSGAWETIALPAVSSPVNTENFLFIDGSNNAHLGYDAATLEEATFLGF